MKLSNPRKVFELYGNGPEGKHETYSRDSFLGLGVEKGIVNEVESEDSRYLTFYFKYFMQMRQNLSNDQLFIKDTS